MSSVVQIESDANTAQSLPALIDRAASALVAARTSGEVLEARDLAAVAYDAAKSAGRMARAKQAHDDLIGAVYRAQADAALIEARAKIRLADEYDAAQERGEVATVGKRSQEERLVDAPPSAADIGLSRKEIHEARTLRDAEVAQPGVIEKAVSDRLNSGQEPTKAAIKKVAQEVSGRKPPEKPSATNDVYAQLASLQEQLDEANATCAELAMDLEAAQINASEDKDDQVRTLIGRLHVAESQRDQYMEKCNQLIKQNRQLQRVIDKLEGGRRAA
jgi:hypothetical protein